MRVEKILFILWRSAGHVPGKPRENRAHTCPPAPEWYSLPCHCPADPTSCGQQQQTLMLLPSPGVKPLRLAVATAATMDLGRCCHRRYRGAAAGRDRQQAAEETRDLVDRPEEGGCSSASSLTGTCFAACVQLSLILRATESPRRSAVVPEIGFRVRWVRVSCHSSLLPLDLPNRRRRGGSGSAEPIGRKPRLTRERERERERERGGEREREREGVSAKLQFTWPQRVVSPLCFPSYRRNTRVCVRSRRDVFILNPPDYCM